MTEPFVCKKCGSKNFEVLESEVRKVTELEVMKYSNFWQDGEIGEETETVLIEKQKCEDCGTLHKAVYHIVSWEEWKET